MREKELSHTDWSTYGMWVQWIEIKSKNAKYLIKKQPSCDAANCLLAADVMLKTQNRQSSGITGSEELFLWTHD